MSIKLKDHQVWALDKLHSGAVLNGGVGSGKSYTSLFFYKKKYSHLNLYVITTAKKRDSKDWIEEAGNIGITNITVDSWNNISRYTNVNHSFFIFDEQRAVGYGKWAKSMIKIAHKNKWIMLSATPGDKWIDFLAIFIANGFYRNKTDFIEQHVEYDPWVSYPKIKKYHNQGKLVALRNKILVPMVIERHTTRHRKFVETKYNPKLYSDVVKKRWNVFEDKPIENASEFTQVLRKIVGTDEDRIHKARWIMDVHDKVVVFYNYNYELDILIDICEKLDKPYSQWNGHQHQEIPDSESWVYLVQYISGSEGWNCTDTNIMLFYSLNYSYRMTEQAEGRIDRMNTEYTDLEYFYLTSLSDIDRSIRKAVVDKKKFNESAWAKRRGLSFEKKVSSKKN